MKGYFSRIAKQSGLRFPQPQPEARASPGGARIKPPVPDFEQTVMVAPDFVQSNGAVALEPVRPPIGRSMPATERAAAAAGNSDDRVRENVTRAPIAPETRDPPAGMQTISAARENSGATRLMQPAAPTGDDAAGAPRVIEQTTFRDSDPSRNQRAQTQHFDTPPRVQPDTPSPEDAVGLAPTSQEFFAKTAEILGNERAVTPELQTIVLREVQEWVAAAPADPQLAHAEPPVRDEPRAAKARQARAPGVVTIRENERAEKPVRAQPIEQNFDLSIGAINITIEEPEKPRVPEPQTRQPGKTVRDDESRFSRLSRSYL